eukprot:3686046-Amphidinium_carterae.1
MSSTVARKGLSGIAPVKLLQETKKLCNASIFWTTPSERIPVKLLTWIAKVVNALIFRKLPSGSSPESLFL